MSKQPTVQYLKDYKPTPYQIHSIHLHVDLHEDKTLVSSVMDISRKPEASHDAPLVLDGDELELQHISIDGHPVKKENYKQTSETLTIFDLPKSFKLETIVEIHPEKNTKLMGIYKSGKSFASQCESNGFRRITYFMDRPDILTRFTTCISADQKQYPFLLSNGNLVEKRELQDGRQWVKWEDPSLKPCYLFALVAGDFDLIEDVFETQSKRPVKLQVFVEKGKKDQAYHSMTSLKNAMKWDEEAFGREYDLDQYMIVAVNDFNFGAMENKGLNIFNDAYILAKPETATDQDYLNVESVVGHEYFHNWSGNRVTVRDWFQITLKEGLTVLREQSFMEETTAGIAHRIAEVNILKNRQFPEDAGPMAHPIRPEHYIEINNFYTSTVYCKGAEVIRMIRTLLGYKTFRKAMDLYFKRNDGGAVTTEDFAQAMEDASGIDLTQFKLWYSQAGTPILKVTDHYDASEKTYTLTIEQSCPKAPADEGEKKPFHIPVAFGLLNKKGEEIQLEKEKMVLGIKEKQETFVFKNISSCPIPSLLRGFSAPVKLKYDYEFEDLLLLAEHDSDEFNRWDAMQRLFIYCFEEKLSEPPAEFIKLFERILASEAPAILIAQMLTMPSESYLLDTLSDYDVDTLHTFYKNIKTHIAKSLTQALIKAYKKNHIQNDNQYSLESIGKRALKNLCLDYLLSLEDQDGIQLAEQQFNQTINMTDRMGALKPLTGVDCSERKALLSEFYELFKHEALIVDKWLKLQAEADLPDVFDQINQLMKHSSFDIKNPNRVRALVGSFSQNNLIHFHRIDGKGYQFLAEQVLNVDRYNPMVASRLVEPLIQWKKMDKARQDLMKKALEDIKNESKLSKNVFEIVSKGLK